MIDLSPINVVAPNKISRPWRINIKRKNDCDIKLKWCTLEYLNKWEVIENNAGIICLLITFASTDSMALLNRQYVHYIDLCEEVSEEII